MLSLFSPCPSDIDLHKENLTIHLRRGPEKVSDVIFDVVAVFRKKTVALHLDQGFQVSGKLVDAETTLPSVPIISEFQDSLSVAFRLDTPILAKKQRKFQRILRIRNAFVKKNELIRFWPRWRTLGDVRITFHDSQPKSLDAIWRHAKKKYGILLHEGSAHDELLLTGLGCGRCGEYFLEIKLQW